MSSTEPADASPSPAQNTDAESPQTISPLPSMTSQPLVQPTLPTLPGQVSEENILSRWNLLNEVRAHIETLLKHLEDPHERSSMRSYADTCSSILQADDADTLSQREWDWYDGEEYDVYRQSYAVNGCEASMPTFTNEVYTMLGQMRLTIMGEMIDFLREHPDVMRLHSREALGQLGVDLA